MAQQYIHKNCTDRVMRHPLLRDMTFETVVFTVLDFIRETKCTQTFNFDKERNRF